MDRVPLSPPDKSYSVISLDLVDHQAAIEVAGKIAASTGWAVTVRNAEGNVIAFVPAATKT
jgi:hypothetical protein